jgi:hypothetical protein
MSGAQSIFKTIVPQQPVAIGESFSVQYVLEDVEKNDGFTAPHFKDFRLASGPYVYSINGSKPMKNIVYTLVATRTGRFIIPGATAKVNGRFIKSDDAVVEIITKTEAFERSSKGQRDDAVSEYFLRPGEDPYEKMRKNLFMKVMVDKKTCYVGEPLVATFKLYSRLESKSDIVKNPGFYGFAVQDMISLGDNMVTTETISGKSFDVHTVRKVQLYPMQEGEFIIDPMEVMNRVEFSRSTVNRKTEQQIEEGVLERNNDHSADDNTVTYENNISTEKIAISVKPYPVKKRPALFNGATGNFLITAVLEKNELARNEEGDLIVTLSGKGNFTQLVPPVIGWPDGMEGFDAKITDVLNKTYSPLKGARTFRYPFVASNSGIYTIPAITFSFFDPDSNNYKTVSAAAIEIKVTDLESKIPAVNIVQQKKIKKNKPGILWWAGGGVLFIFILIAAAVWIKRKKKPAPAALKEKVQPGLEEILLPVALALKSNDSRFYVLLQKSIWDHVGAGLKLSGSKMNKPDLYKAMREKKLPEDQCREILNLLQQCEAAIFTEAEFVDDKQELLNRTRTALEQIKIG